MSEKLNIAVVGATGAVGEAMLSILAEYGFRDAKVHALASERSLGKTVDFGNRCLAVEVLDDFDTAKAERHLRELANPAEVFTLSARRPETLENWLGWLRNAVAAHRAGAEMKPSVQPDGASLHHPG